MSKDYKDLLTNICRNYTESPVLSAFPLGDGHINDTFLSDTAEGKYVVQRVGDKLDTAKFEYNYELYADILDKNGIYYPVWLKNTSGKRFFTDENGFRWRMYKYIDSEIKSVPLKIKQLFFVGQGLSKLHMTLREIKESPRAVYPHLHDLKYYYDTYVKLRNSDELCKENIDKTIDKAIDDNIDKMLSIDPVKDSVVHGDAKLANILFKDDKVIGFIDFDTIMNGSWLEDVADCIRSCCIDDGELNISKAKRLINGYLSISDNDKMCEDIRNEMNNIGDVFNKICFELGLRYYTDALAKEKYFKEKYPGYSLERAKSLFSVKSQGIISLNLDLAK